MGMESEERVRGKGGLSGWMGQRFLVLFHCSLRD